MSDTANYPATMRGRTIRVYGKEMVLMDDLQVPTRTQDNMTPSNQCRLR
ncbi:hypothetical protein [Noviherbaspirillum malthae]|jgi:hypothetical protein|nr:hypothetical protein [Noviherbaspirillum malthae]